MRIVLDTNVLVAAYATEGACMRLFRHCVRHHRVVISQRLVGELEQKMLKKLRIAPADVAAAVAELLDEVEVIDPTPLAASTSRDPDDDWVLATAASGSCHCIVTGDADLLVLGSYDGIAIIPPRDFWQFEIDQPA